MFPHQSNAPAAPAEHLVEERSNIPARLIVHGQTGVRIGADIRFSHARVELHLLTGVEALVKESYPSEYLATIGSAAGDRIDETTDPLVPGGLRALNLRNHFPGVRLRRGKQRLRPAETSRPRLGQNCRRIFQ